SIKRKLFLKDTFLAYINNWQKETKKLKLPAKEQAKYCISLKTLDGIRMTVHSYCEMVPELLKLDGVDMFLSDKLNQDPVEEQFAKHRASSVENPQLEWYMMTERKLIVAKSKMVVAINGNFRGRTKRKVAIEIDDLTLVAEHCMEVNYLLINFYIEIKLF
uniref:Uncharacterized protein n=1 Tax=Clytia hemisphaerica TaxID=252671 RepID=A0A7M5WKZ1_9CNID